MNKHYLRYLIFLWVTFLLSSCATMKSPVTHENLIHSNEWGIDGKVGIQSPEVNGSASIIWQQNKDIYNIHFFGPLGLGRVTLNGDDNQVKYIDQYGKIYTANSPELLLKQNLGWDMPISDLIYWIRALPAPDVSSVKNYNANHQLILLKQQGWTINYLEYSENNLPQFMTLNRANIKLKIRINHWIL